MASRNNSLPRTNSINVGNDPDIAYSGWLIKAPPLKHAKESSTKRWRKRFFVLRRSMLRLTYYASNEDVNSIKGEIDLKLCQRVQLSVDGGRKKHVFSLRFPNREYFFQAMNEGDMIKWGHHLTELFDSRSKSIQSASGLDTDSTNPSSTTVNQRLTTVPTSTRASKVPSSAAQHAGVPAGATTSTSTSGQRNEAHLGPKMRDRSQSIAPPPNRGPQCPPPPAPPTSVNDSGRTTTSGTGTDTGPPRPHQRKPADAAPSPSAPADDTAPPFAPRAPPAAAEADTNADANANVSNAPLPPRRTSSVGKPNAGDTAANINDNTDAQKRRADERATAPLAPGRSSRSPEPAGHGTVGHRDSVVARHRATAVAAVQQQEEEDIPPDAAGATAGAAPASQRRVLMLEMDEDDDNDNDDDDNDNDGDNDNDTDDDCFDDYDNADQYFSPEERMQLELADWEQVVDPTTGDTYYHNVVTGVTSWEKPGSIPVVEPAADVWEEVRDDDGQRYFYNAGTGQSSWTDPRVEHEEIPGTVLYDFTASKVDEVSVTAGDSVLVVTNDDGSGWIKIKTIGAPTVEGFVPLSYVEFQDDLEC
eukprot:m.281301 g.281301  ORF g.281301 m.281301 type:complete len:588 (-) comp19837_c0_seq1:284-2047(-)